MDVSNLNIPVGTFEEFNTDFDNQDSFFFAEGVTYEDPDDEANNIDFVQTSEGPYLVDENGDTETTYKEELQEITSEPVSRGFYVLKQYAEGMWLHEIAAMADKLRNLNVAVVRSGLTLGLALTGGGMDLDWQLAAAHIRLGYLPASDLRLASFSYGVTMLGLDEATRVAEARLYDLNRKQRLAANDHEYLAMQMVKFELPK